MANEEIAPALTAEEWADLPRMWPGVNIAGHATTDEWFAGMAECNAHLPDGDPRKITRADVQALHGLLSDNWSAEAEYATNDEDCAEYAKRRRAGELLAAKLAAILPPIGTPHA